MKFCSQCGSQINDDAMFCRKCGAKQRVEIQPMQPQPRMQPQQPMMTQQPMQPQQKKSNGRRIVCIILSIVLFLECVILAFVYPGFLRKALMKNDATVNKVEILFPEPTEEELLVSLSADLSIHYYTVARMYLEKFLQYDIENGSIEEYEALLDDTIVAFENAEKMSGGLCDAVDLWMDAEDTDAEVEYKILSLSSEAGDFYADPFVVPVYAAADSPAIKWAKDITEAYDKAPAGKGLRTLADQMGTDAKHAYAQLKQAQAILEGAEYTEIADAANKAYETALVLKTAGTAAGLVIAAAPIAAGGTVAATAGGILEGVCTAGGAVMSGINTVLEVGSTASILYNNGEDNAFSRLCNSVESRMAPIGALFGLGGAAANVRNLVQNGNKLIKDGKSILQSTELTDDAFGLIAYTSGALNDYVQDGVLIGGTFTKTDEGIKLTLSDTMIGPRQDQQEAMKQVLKDAGVPSKEVKEILKAAAKNIEKGMRADDFPPVLPEEGEVEEMIPLDVVDQILEENQGILPGENDFDLDGFLEALHELENEVVNAGSVPDEPSSEEEDKISGNDSGEDLSRFEGLYQGSHHCTSYFGSEPDESTDDRDYVCYLFRGVPVPQAVYKGVVDAVLDGSLAAAMDESNTVLTFDPKTLTGYMEYSGGGGAPNKFSWQFTETENGQILLHIDHTTYWTKDGEFQKVGDPQFERVGDYTWYKGYK